MDNPNDQLDIFDELDSIPSDNLIVEYRRVDPDNIVRKGKEFNNMPLDLNLLDSKFINTLISLVSPEDDHLKEYRIGIKDFINASTVDDDAKRYYSLLPRIAEKLMQPRTFTDPRTGATVSIALISRSTHLPGSGYISVLLGPDLRQHLLSLKSNNLVEYQLGTILQMKSKYSISLYEKVILWIKEAGQDTFDYSISYSDFRTLMGIDTKKYSRPALFRKNVLDVAIAEIESTTNIRISLEEVRPGKALEGYIFHIAKLNNTINITRINNQLDTSIRTVFNPMMFAKLCDQILTLIKHDSRFDPNNYEIDIAKLLNRQTDLILELQRSKIAQPTTLILKNIESYLK